MSAALGLDAIRRVARGITVGMLIVWSAFLAVQIYEWFIFRWPTPTEHWPATPPAYVWGQLAVCVLLLVGLAIGLRRELPGGLVAIVAAVVLCGWLAPGETPSPGYALLVGMPAVLLVACWYLGRQRRPAPIAADVVPVWAESSSSAATPRSGDRRLAEVGTLSDSA